MTAVVDRRNRLQASSDGVFSARRFVRAAMDEVGCSREVAEVALLLVTEIGGNAARSASTSIEVRVMATDGWVRVEVRDRARILSPVAGPDEQAMTGRAIELVESLASSWGTDPDPVGRVVWFEVGARPASAPVDERSCPTLPIEPSLVVCLDRAPAALVVAALEHAATLVRQATGTGTGTVTGTPLDLDPLLVAAKAALADSRLVADLEVVVALTATVTVARRRSSIHRSQRRGDGEASWTTPALAEVDRCLLWILDEISGQLTGLAATPWPAPDPDELRTAWAMLLDHDTDRSGSSSLAVGMVVADASGRFVHVSDSAARMLGWEADELVGQRLTAIIPPGRREDHVVAFARFQLGGPARILGRTRRVQALRRDGSLIDVDLTIDELDRRGAERGVVASLEEISDQARVQTEPEV